MKCRHPPDWTRYVGRMVDGHIMSRTWCGRCRAYTPMGPATDTPATAIELRAALLACNDGPIKTCDNAMPDDCEECGWDCWPFVDLMKNASDAEWAGYLAHAIVEHDIDHKDSTP